MGMVFGIGRKDARDMQDAQQPAGVPYRLASYEHDHEGKRFRSSNVVYSFWSASKYVFILSIILWWLPMFGQMIAGYVGGRRAGGPWRGVAASILPVVCLYVVITGFDSGFFPSHLFGVAIAPAAVSAVLSDSVPFVSPYIQFSSEYVGSFVAALSGASPYGINTYVLTVAFAYVGGILAEQSRREIEFTSGATMTNTTVLMSDGQNPHLPQAQHPWHSNHGLAHMISSAFPWSKHDAHEQHPHAMMAAGDHGSWSRAVPMRYEDGYGGGVPAAMLPPPEFMEQEAVLTGAKATRRRARAHNLGSTRGSPWLRSDRRVKQHFTSARRFAPQQPEFVTERPTMKTRKVRPAHHEVPRIIPGDAKSVRKARKVIDEEWGHRRYPNLGSSPARRARPVSDEVPSSEPQPHHRAPKPPQNHWDSI